MVWFSIDSALCVVSANSFSTSRILWSSSTSTFSNSRTTSLSCSFFNSSCSLLSFLSSSRSFFSSSSFFRRIILFFIEEISLSYFSTSAVISLRLSLASCSRPSASSMLSLIFCILSRTLSRTSLDMLNSFQVRKRAEKKVKRERWDLGGSLLAICTVLSIYHMCDLQLSVV